MVGSYFSMKHPDTNWTVRADLPTPPDPSTTTLNSRIVDKGERTSCDLLGSELGRCSGASSLADCGGVFFTDFSLFSLKIGDFGSVLGGECHCNWGLFFPEISIICLRG